MSRMNDPGEPSRGMQRSHQQQRLVRAERGPMPTRELGRRLAQAFPVERDAPLPPRLEELVAALGKRLGEG